MLIFLSMLLMIDRGSFFLILKFQLIVYFFLVLKWYRWFEINLFQQVQSLGKRKIFFYLNFTFFSSSFRIPMILVGNKIDRKTERYTLKFSKKTKQSIDIKFI